MNAFHTQPLQTWAVVATVDEPAVLVAAFARHHLAIGASEVISIWIALTPILRP